MSWLDNLQWSAMVVTVVAPWLVASPLRGQPRRSDSKREDPEQRDEANGERGSTAHDHPRQTAGQALVPSELTDKNVCPTTPHLPG